MNFTYKYTHPFGFDCPLSYHHQKKSKNTLRFKIPCKISYQRSKIAITSAQTLSLIVAVAAERRRVPSDRV